MDPNEQTPNTEGTPAPEAPEPTEGQEVNWQERYSNLQPEYTRATQEAAQLRQQLDSLKSDPEAQQAFLKELGYEIETDEPEPNTPQMDPEQQAWLEAQLDKRLAPLEQNISQAEQERQIAALDNHFEQSFQKFSKDRGSELTDDEKAALVGLALTMEPENGMPPAEKAWESLERIRNKQLAEWAASKNTPHRVSPVGAEGTDTPDLDDDQQRVAWMTQRLADLNAG